MKRFIFSCCICLVSLVIIAGDNDPVVMKINGKEVLRSEFEYNFNKNNGENVVEQKSIDEYVELFINYKLKVEAALDARYDTLSSFKKEFATYRNQQIIPYFVSAQVEENEVRNYYDVMKRSIGEDGLIFPAHIMTMAKQKASQEEWNNAKIRIDSIYNALQGGVNFEVLAQQCSEDKGSSNRGGALGWISRGQTIKEFDDAAFALKKGELSKVIKSPMGYHIILMKDRKQLESYEELRPQIQDFLEQRGFRDRIAAQTIDSLGKATHLSSDEIIERKCQELCAVDNDLKYLIQEYHDGLLLYEISLREIWDKAAKDEIALARYFKANKSKYKWEKPRFKGLVCHATDESLQKSVRKLLKSVDEDKWIDTLRATFNRDSVKQIRVEKNLFKEGDNKYVDNIIFKVKESPKPLKKYPITKVYGKKLKKPALWTDVRGEVISDYQAKCESEFVNGLRKKYEVVVYKEVLETVNKH